MNEVPGHAYVSASLPLSDYLWLLEQCHIQKLSRSAIIALFIHAAREQQELQKGS